MAHLASVLNLLASQSGQRAKTNSEKDGQICSRTHMSLLSVFVNLSVKNGPQLD
jgi:hypothetical protein